MKLVLVCVHGCCPLWYVVRVRVGGLSCVGGVVCVCGVVCVVVVFHGRGLCL